MNLQETIEALSDSFMLQRLIRGGIEVAYYEFTLDEEKIQAIKDYFSVFFEGNDEYISMACDLVDKESERVLDVERIDINETFETIRAIYSEIHEEVIYNFFDEIIIGHESENFDTKSMFENILGYEKTFSQKINLNRMIHAGLAVYYVENSHRGWDKYTNIVDVFTSFFSKHLTIDWIEDIVHEAVHQEIEKFENEYKENELMTILKSSLDEIKIMYEGNELMVAELFEDILIASADNEFEINHALLNDILDILDN